jgi:hypothetical protein
MGTEAFRVFLYLNARLDFENLIVVPQTEIAAALSMKQAAASRAIRLLVGKQIIVCGSGGPGGDAKPALLYQASEEPGVRRSRQCGLRVR